MSAKNGAVVICPECGRGRYRQRALIERGIRYCSRECATDARKGKVPANLAVAQAKSPIKPGNQLARALKGRKRPPFTEEWRQNMSLAMSRNPKRMGSNHWNWKGGRSPRSNAMSADTRAYAKVLRNDVCAYCGETSRDLDHIEPVLGGGANDWANLTSACHSCNARKGTQPLLQFLTVS